MVRSYQSKSDRRGNSVRGSLFKALGGYPPGWNHQGVSKRTEKFIGVSLFKALGGIPSVRIYQGEPNKTGNKEHGRY